MMTNETKQPRDRANGQYAPSIDRPCRCGHSLDVHTADRRTVDGVRYQPCIVDEVVDGAEPCSCECFKAARKAVR